MSERNLQDRVAIITGAGSGIGRAMSLLFAGAGAKVLVVDVIEDRARATAELVAAQGGIAKAVALDITDEAGVARVVGDAATGWGEIDILCNNAGKMDRMQVAPDMELATWERVIAVNATGTFLMLRAVLPHMIAKRAGVIVNTASAAGIRGGAAGIAYTAAKHAVVGITRSVATMHVNDGIRCNAICPGAVNTDIIATADGPLDETGMQRITPVLAAMRPAAEPEQIAQVALFLVSDAASYINGAIMPVDGGWSGA